MKLDTKLIIIIVKRISRAPIYCTRWEHRVLYNNTNNTHTHMHTRVQCDTHTHSCVRRGIGMAVKKTV